MHYKVEVSGKHLISLGDIMMITVLWGFSGSPVVETSPFSAGAVSLIAGREAKIPQASGPKKSKNVNNRSNVVKIQ